jgi:predicted oxidoreductase
VINNDRMWHYTEECNRDPVWPNHGIRVCRTVPAARRHWHRIPALLFPDSTRRNVGTSSDRIRLPWFILNQHIIGRVRAVRLDRTPTSRGKHPVGAPARSAEGQALVEALAEHAPDLSGAHRSELVADERDSGHTLNYAAVEHAVRVYDEQVVDPDATDAQVLRPRGASYTATARSRRQPKADPRSPCWPLDRGEVATSSRVIADATDLSARVLSADGLLIPDCTW